MSGGIAYVLDEENKLYKNLNKELVKMESIETKSDAGDLRHLIEEHYRYTGSRKAKEVLDHFDVCLPYFKKIIPTDYKEILRLIAESEERGADSEEAKIEAFRAFVGGV